MCKQDRLAQVGCLILILLTQVAAADMLHLSPEGGWQKVDQMPEGEYLLAVSKIKQQLVSGSGDDVVEALTQLKADFPDMAGPEINAFIEAEKEYADNNLHIADRLYKEFLDKWPVSSLQPAAMERYYSIGVGYLQGQKRKALGFLWLPAYDYGVTIMEDIADRAGNGPLAYRALVTLAESHERKEKYFEAYQVWTEVSSRWPTGEIGQQALLRTARALHASYNGEQYDASVLRSARSYFEDFAARYPEEAERQKIQETLDLINEQLAYKDYTVAYYYERTENDAAAERYYAKVTEQWPDSEASAMALARLTPEAPSPVQKNFRRRMFNGTCAFLDTWFGVEHLFDEVLPESEKSKQLIYEDQKPVKEITGESQ